MVKERFFFIDIARGIAIICIVLGHLGVEEIDRVIFTFHVPIFFLITGYFLDARRPLATFVAQKARTLLVPYAVTAAVIILLAPFVNEFLGDGVTSKALVWEWLKAALYGSGINDLNPFDIRGIGAIWFLWATFWGALFLRLTLVLRPGQRLFVILLLLFIGLWSPKLMWLPLSLQPGCCAAAFMYVGQQVRTVLPAVKTFPTEIKAVFTVLALAMWIAFMIDFRSFFVVRCDLGGVMDICACLCGCYIVFCLSRLLEKVRFLGAGLAFMGRYSIFVLCAHIVELDLFPYWRLLEVFRGWGLAPGWDWVVLIPLKFAWILPLTILGSRWEPLRRLFGLGPRREKEVA